MSANRGRDFDEQFEFEPPEFGKLQIIPKDETIVEELRNRLRKSEAARFRAEANLSIAREENNKLAARLKELGGQLYKLWRSADGPHAGNRR